MGCPMRVILALVSVVVALIFAGKSVTSTSSSAVSVASEGGTSEKKGQEVDGAGARARQDKCFKRELGEMLTFCWQAFSGTYLWRLYRASVSSARGKKQSSNDSCGPCECGKRT